MGLQGAGVRASCPDESLDEVRHRSDAFENIEGARCPNAIGVCGQTCRHELGAIVFSSSDFSGGANSHKLKSVDSLLSNKHPDILLLPLTNQHCHFSYQVIGNSFNNLSK